ncbi:MAG: hypothetical protein A3G33_06165 [Omnitrophica bacterium RIFCSPLOWO2_12_FULL_44_17]|uniref:Diguanylate cyclase n=1 Tax=Candidatus Danuiimicrobium aquiferis TaxID=1801832 RepID=A0A1G1KR56_9BACT|nr:MAG: hypothetical protein A3B72_02650 [Omnitrophica bacterium RIFCSPHIGHO2_02_FULL_45_28]OGW88080.1 MAG: hypothetical protein A3E74_00635 [Omnitrophica bacterium RIFCSPHIGHO2_12_FULL_44_12]OGW95368.1 MAG: hypothetical protein A3G33_06165 [Omnitrophica bacterium RIFCSPLOWO2_12_FULL_44_17]OGX04070.1 MAG: hypothetical protein A3J12_08730 [Omnitrophica bacterium RIFCSPLOWO2_02_FULL_44_11]
MLQSDQERIKVLLIEDDAAYAKLLQNRLGREVNPSIDLRSAQSLHTGLEEIGKFKPDVILLDLTLPDSSPKETVEAVKNISPKIPVVILSGLDNEDIAVKAVRGGVEDYLVKSEMEGKTLSRILKHAIERSRIKQDIDIANERLKQLSVTDPLTGLLNRRGIEQVLSREIQWSKREGSNLLVILLDLDDFKNVNDTFGHSAGDFVLTEVARRMKENLRTTDYIARIGGDEFIVLLPHARLAEGAHVGEKLREGISQAPVFLPSGNSVQITSSFGLSDTSNVPMSLDGLLEKVEEALRKSKKFGKNRVSTIPNIEEEKENHLGNKYLSIVNTFRGGDQLHVVAQPIWELGSHQVNGYEFLSRSDVEGFEMPDDFFEFCSANNILNIVDYFCYSNCVKASQSVPKEILRHINLFPSTLANTRVERLLDILPVAIPKFSYCIEISEQQIIGEPSYLVAPIKALKNEGLLIAVDTVGFGRSSFESLILLEPNFIKIDRRFIDGISHDDAKVRSFKRIMNVASGLGAEVIAEGIERREDYEILKTFKVTYGQGFLWGKPFLVNEHTNWDSL